LFSSGVGYFNRAGRIDGSAAVDLSFRAEQVNDILKSLVLFDPGGTVKPVTYATREAVPSRVGAAAQAIDPNLTLGTLLRRFQGARVRLEMGEAVEGRIVSVSMKALPAVDGIVQTDVVNVLTEGGLRAVPLEQVRQVKLLDERLDRELRESLEMLAGGLNDDRRKVELHFAGKAAREVRAAYLQEMPVWKTSYRLVLDDKEKPYLQGWAHVENTTDEDWKEVRLSLVSGRPISFIQDLYQPLYIPRPVVQAQVTGSPVPQTYGEILGFPMDEKLLVRGTAEDVQALKSIIRPGVAPVPQPGPEKRVTLGMRDAPLRTVIDQIFAGTGIQYAVDASVPDVPITIELRDASVQSALRSVIRLAAPRVPGLTATRDGDIYLVRLKPPASNAPVARAAAPETSAVSGEVARSVAAQAVGAERGELFEYAVKQPVTLAKGQAAMVPIVSGSIEGERLSIYDPDADARHALNGIRLKNTTGLHLAGGPITVFRSGVYAGDAQVTDVRPGEERLLSYAVDLDLAAASEAPRVRQETLSLSAKSGVLRIARKQRQERVYTFRNKGDAPKTVLVQQNAEPEFKLVEPARPAEKTADEYRFRVEVPAKGTASLKVVTERPLQETVALVDADLDLIVAHAQNAETPEKLRAALKQLVGFRQKITGLQGERAALEGELKTIDQEQSRIRQNMAQLDRNSPLYLQYVKKLTDQEARIEKLREEIARLRDAEAAAQKEMRVFVDALTIG
jgi:hypothetical protein